MSAFADNRGDEAARTWGDRRLAIVGGGTMGAGIAALAAEHGVSTAVCEVSPQAAEAAEKRIAAILRRRRDRGKLTESEAAQAGGRVSVVPSLAGAEDAALVIEAAPEQLELKRGLLQRLSARYAAAVLASNTSSLPISQLAPDDSAERTLGLHFFNPPGAIRFVELVRTERTSDAAVDLARALVTALGDECVTVPDVPGFLVNRCARPYYLESLRIVAAGLADPADVDQACERLGGFPMGPFRLMDLIGIDTNLAVAKSLWEASGEQPRWRPSPIQEAMVAAGRLGRKSGEGFYTAEGAQLPLPELKTGPPPEPASEERPRPEDILLRVVAQLVNEAWFAIDAGIATPEQLDRAMVAALRYPRGPVAWGREVGEERIVALLDELAGPAKDPVYRVAAALRARSERARR